MLNNSINWVYTLANISNFESPRIDKSVDVPVTSHRMLPFACSGCSFSMSLLDLLVSSIESATEPQPLIDRHLLYRLIVHSVNHQVELLLKNVLRRMFWNERSPLTSAGSGRTCCRSSGN